MFRLLVPFFFVSCAEAVSGPGGTQKPDPNQKQADICRMKTSQTKKNNPLHFPEVLKLKTTDFKDTGAF